MGILVVTNQQNTISRVVKSKTVRSGYLFDFYMLYHTIKLYDPKLFSSETMQTKGMTKMSAAHLSVSEFQHSLTQLLIIDLHCL